MGPIVRAVFVNDVISARRAAAGLKDAGSGVES